MGKVLNAGSFSLGVKRWFFLSWYRFDGTIKLMGMWQDIRNVTKDRTKQWGHSERMQLSSVFSNISKFSPYILPRSLN